MIPKGTKLTFVSTLGMKAHFILFPRAWEAAAPDSSAAPAPAKAGGSGPSAHGASPAAPAEPGGEIGEDLSVADPFAFAGPSDPAAIDILEEGGFSPDKAYSGRRISLDF